MRTNSKQMLATAADAERRSKITKHKSRGTVDELEIMRLILTENRGLYMRVLSKIKAMREISEQFKKNAAPKRMDDV